MFDQVSVTAAHLWAHQDGVEDWPQNFGGDIGRGHWRFASSGDIRLGFHEFSGVQTQMSVHCTVSPGQDLAWGETVVAR